MTRTASAHPNIAFIKYWGNRDGALRLPVSGSISMNLAALRTRTSVTFRGDLKTGDVLTVNGQETSGAALTRVSEFMNEIRRLSGEERFAEIVSENNFPMGAGIASSASAFAALALAGSAAAGLKLSEAECSRLARMGSGSACRSVPGGFCEWLYGSGDADSIAVSIAPAEHWTLTDLIAVISGDHKKVGSSAGHGLAATGPYQQARIDNAPERLDKCRNAILDKDFASLAEVSERDCMLMHAVMMTSFPPLLYWEPASVALIKSVKAWREEGLPCFCTLDAGPNVHVICPSEAAGEVRSRMERIPGVKDILSSASGGKAELL